MESGAVVFMFFVLLIGAIMLFVGVSRWVFRINDIVAAMKEMNEKLSILCRETGKQTTMSVNPETPCEKCGYKPLRGIIKVDGRKGAECPSCRAFYPW